MPSTLPYGSWPSPITAASTTAGTIRFADVVHTDGDDLYWVESRPAEGGRSVIVRRDAAGHVGDVVPADFDARTRVHEYGGAGYGVHSGAVYAARFDDQRWYRIAEGTVEPITPEPAAPAALRYADPAFGNGWMIVVRETHPADGGEPTNDLVRIDLTGANDPMVVASGHDFFAAPRISPDGTRIAWITWDHPRMPWDGTDLWVTDVDGTGAIGEPAHVAGGAAESVLTPVWSPAGTLHFTSDRTGWWNIYRLDGDRVESVHPADAEYAGPLWVLGMCRFGFVDRDRIVAREEDTGGERLVVITGDGTEPIPLPYIQFGSLAIAGDTVYLPGSAFDRPTAIIGVDIATGDVTTIRSAGAEVVRDYVSVPERITFDTPDGPAHAVYYPPTNPDFAGPDGNLPPLIVSIHGGPTSRLGMSLDPERLFWTSRGFAIVDVDHGGSTGYGRAYRERLRGQWGVVDVRDCALAAAHCAEHGLADPMRLLIHGGSAGGFSTLMALATTDVFAAGVASYPVTDLTMLASDTHKFESRYLDSMIGSYPERRDLYLDRSPTTRVDDITSPVLLLQGLEDRVVPPSQPEAMRDALIARGTPVGYLAFPGEGHGFRSASARVRAMEAELWFYGKVLGFEPHDDLEAVDVTGL